MGWWGGGIHRACPSKEEIWHFSPVPVLNAYQFIKTWIQERKVIDWRTVIFGVCIGLEALRLVLSRKFGTHLLFSFDPHSNIALLCMFVSAISCLGVPLRIWGSARTERMLKEQESLVLKARFEALRSQINPHFLFNTLNSIASSIRSNPDRAREIIVKLSRILRRLLSNDQDFVPLREELEFIDAYLDIEVIRFGRDKLRIHKAIDDGALDVLVPAMMLQPLVENAIRHGLAPKLDGGRIVLRAMRNGHGTRVEVEDNGVGISNERAGEAAGGSGSATSMSDCRWPSGRRCGSTSTAGPASGRGSGPTFRSRAPSASGRMGEMGLTTVIADDEQLARDELCFLLEDFPEVTVLDRAANGVEALQMIDRLTPDLAMLDVQMPGLTGFQVVEQLLQRGRLPYVVFVTAYDQYALKAFEVNATDYLLKPIERARLSSAIQKVKERMEASESMQDRIVSLLDALRGQRHYTSRLSVRGTGKVLLIDASDLVYATVEEGAIYVATPSARWMTSYRTLEELEADLDPHVFCRTHRSYLVNIHQVAEIIPWFSGTYHLKMKDEAGTEVPLSRTQVKNLRKILKW
ncbi:MAG: response regulator [Candidatus Latescibacteria bacterium]|nr:response regulator [Candidatus Latescibacterota bacterium]